MFDITGSFLLILLTSPTDGKRPYVMQHLSDWQAVDLKASSCEVFPEALISFYRWHSSPLVVLSALLFVDSTDDFAVHSICCDTEKKIVLNK